MKKIIFTILTLLVLTLTACASASGTTQTGPTASSASLSPETQLIIGTFKLEGTDQDVTAEQAEVLLPLWQTLQVLYDSDTAAQEEIDALISQIQETMSTDQMQAITAMNLTQQDVFAVMQEQGTGISNRNSDSDSSISTQGGGGFAPPDGGGMPMGGPPDGGMPGGFGSGNQSQSTTQSDTSTTQMDPATLLLDALIKFLQLKAES